MSSKCLFVFTNCVFGFLLTSLWARELWGELQAEMQLWRSTVRYKDRAVYLPSWENWSYMWARCVWWWTRVMTVLLWQSDKKCNYSVSQQNFCNVIGLICRMAKGWVFVQNIGHPTHGIGCKGGSVIQLPWPVSLLQLVIVICLLGWVYTSQTEILGHCRSSESQSRAWNCAAMGTQCVSGAVEGPWLKITIVKPVSEGPETEEEMKREDIIAGN